MAGIQSSGERRALHAAWKAHPQVLGLEAALARHVRERGPVVSEGGARAMERFMEFLSVPDGEL